MYFGAELIDARESQGLESVPIGLIQSAIGGSQIEAWMSNETLAKCKEQSLTGGAVPECAGRLYYGMTAPFANFSVAGWLWCKEFVGSSVSVQSNTLPSLSFLLAASFPARWSPDQGENK